MLRNDRKHLHRTCRPAPRLHAFVIAIALGLAACDSAPERHRGNDSGRVATLDEVPERYREAWAAWMAGGERWDAARADALDDPGLRQALIDNWIVVMGRFYSGRALARRGQNPGPFLRAQRELIALDTESAPSLVELVRAGDSVAAELASDTLVEMDEPRVNGIALRLLEDERADARRRGANLLSRLPHARDDEQRVRDALAALATEDPEWMVRAQVARALGERGARAEVREPTRVALVRCLLDDDPAVHEAACRALERLGDPWAIPALVAHLARLQRESARPASVTSAQEALAGLAGGRRGDSPVEWERWWRREGREALTGSARR